MRMYTMHFGHGMEHTTMFYHMAKGNLPYNYSGWDDGDGAVNEAECDNSQIVSHREIFDRYGVKGGHGEYCLEVWNSASISYPARNACRLPVGGSGDLTYAAVEDDVRAFYLKFDFMYTNIAGGDVVMLSRYALPGSYSQISRDLTISLVNGYLQVYGSKHVTQPETGYKNDSWISRADGRYGKIYLEPNKWHEIQIFIHAHTGWDVSEIGPVPIGLGYYSVDVFKTFFEAYQDDPPTARIKGSESIAYEFDLQLDPWPDNGHPKFPNTMLPGQNQAVWPPENYASGQYFYPEKLGLVYIWVNGKLDIQYTTNMSNEQNGLSMDTKQYLYLGYVIGSDGRFFYNNIIMNDIRDPSGSYPSKIFDPLFSSHESLEWNPNYNLKFTAIQMDTDSGRLIPSGEPYLVAAPNRFGSPTDGMIPHGTKLTVVHVDWNGDEQSYTADTGNPSYYPDYDLDYAYQYIQPEESNPFQIASDPPRLKATSSGCKVLFYLKRPLVESGKQYLAGSYGMGGVKNYSPNINALLGETELPPIYRIWTCIQDHSQTSKLNQQHHLIRVPSGLSGYIDFLSDHQCPGSDQKYAYNNGSASFGDGYSMADWPYNPATNEPWTWDDIDQLQIGAFVDSYSTGTEGIRLLCVYLVVEHASSSDSDTGRLDTNLLDWTVADDIPFYMQTKAMYIPGWSADIPSQRLSYYNRWNVDPLFSINRSDTQSDDSLAIITGMRLSGIIQWDYYLRYMNGEIVEGDQYRKFDEHFDEVWVYTCSGISPSTPRRTMRGEVITDVDGNHYTFLTHPILQWGTTRYPTDPGATPITYDTNTLYVIPLTTYLSVTTDDPDEVLQTWTDPITKPNTSGTWEIRTQQNQFNFQIDKDSYFNIFNPSSVFNHIATHPGGGISLAFPLARTEHTYYFRAPHLASGSVMQTIYLTDIVGIPSVSIDKELYTAHIGLYQTTMEKVSNDTGEGIFEFYSGNPDVTTYISGYSFGLDDTVGWHLNDATITIPSGTRQVRFIFSAVRNTATDKIPGGTMGGTSNMAAFDEPFFIVNLASGNVCHPADVNDDYRIGYDELANYILLWQSGLLPVGQGKKYLRQAEQIWQSGVSTYFGDISGGRYYDANDGPNPENWMGSGYL